MTSRALAGTVVLLLGACGQEPAPPQPRPPEAQPVRPPRAVVAGYDLGAPRRAFTLPHKLREISAVVAVDARTVACLQDEKGTLFFFDLQLGEVRERVQFGPGGDYEGLTKVGDDYWVLRSDGKIERLRRHGPEFEVVARNAVVGPFREYEGLAYDARAGVLVVAPKSLADARVDKELRPLLAVDPATGATAREPYAVVDRERVLAAAARLGVAVPTRERDGRERPDFRLRFAEVAVQPDDGRLWLLSGVDRAVVVVDRAGDVLGLHFFGADELPQPEGATFLPGGELVIASEGAGGTARLCIFGRAR